MDSNDRFFDSEFKQRLRRKCLTMQYPLSELERNRVNTWVELCAETDESLKQRSSSRRSVRRRARYFARRVYAIEAELFVLCSLSYSISALPPIPPGAFYAQLEEWWATKAPQKSLSEVARDVCQHLPEKDRDGERPSESYYPLRSPLSGAEHRVSEEINSAGPGVDSTARHPTPEQHNNQRREHGEQATCEIYGHRGETGKQVSKRPRLEPEASENPPVFGDTPYLSFLFTRRNMIDKIPEPFRTGIETSKLWKDEQERGGLSVTNCLSLYLPETVNEDALLVIRMGYAEGFNVSNILGLGDPEG